MKQMTLTMIPLLCAAFAPLCADAQGTKSSAEQQKMYMDEINKITPSAEPAVTRHADPFITADFIWWRPYEDGLDYAFGGAGPASTTSDVSKGRVHHPSFHYEPGFKVGAGLKCRHDGWDVFAQYTWLNSNRKHHKDTGSADNVQSNINLPRNGQLVTFYADEAAAKWKLNFNVVDLELGRNFWISKWLTLRPFVGLKFDWTRQKFKTEYLGISGAQVDGDIDGDEVEMSMRQKQWAVGTRVGLDTAWYFWKKWAIYGDLAASGMLNNFKVKRKDSIEDIVLDLEWDQNRIKRKSHDVTAVLEWALGLRFETAWHQDDYMFQAQLGWEEQIWFDQNQFVFLPNSAPADLSFQGLTLKVGFWF